jgi:hypothetical protein
MTTDVKSTSTVTKRKPIPLSWVLIAILLAIDLQLLYVVFWLPDV